MYNAGLLVIILTTFLNRIKIHIFIPTLASVLVQDTYHYGDKRTHKRTRSFANERHDHGSTELPVDRLSSRPLRTLTESGVLEHKITIGTLESLFL